MASRYVFKGKILNLRVDTVRLPNGNESTREVVEYAGAVTIAAVDGARRVLLVRQHRYAVGKDLIELPAGKLEAGEDPLECARRELTEETGYRAGKWRTLSRFYSTPGFTSEKMHLFLATDLEPGPPAPDKDEFVEALQVPLDEALRMVERGDICDAKSILGLLMAVRYFNGSTTISSPLAQALRNRSGSGPASG